MWKSLDNFTSYSFSGEVEAKSQKNEGRIRQKMGNIEYRKFWFILLEERLRNGKVVMGKVGLKIF